MNFDRYTDRAKGFVQAAQTLALREGHQQFSPEHLLKVLLDDEEGLAAGLIERAGGQSRQALVAVEQALAKRPKVSGSGAGQLYLTPELARVFDQAEQVADKAGDKFVTVERLLLARENNAALHDELVQVALAPAAGPHDQRGVRHRALGIALHCWTPRGSLRFPLATFLVLAGATAAREDLARADTYVETLPRVTAVSRIMPRAMRTSSTPTPP